MNPSSNRPSDPEHSGERVSKPEARSERPEVAPSHDEDAMRALFERTRPRAARPVDVTALLAASGASWDAGPAVRRSMWWRRAAVAAALILLGVALGVGGAQWFPERSSAPPSDRLPSDVSARVEAAVEARLDAFRADFGGDLLKLLQVQEEMIRAEQRAALKDVAVLLRRDYERRIADWSRIHGAALVGEPVLAHHPVAAGDRKTH